MSEIIGDGSGIDRRRFLQLAALAGAAGAATGLTAPRRARAQQPGGDFEWSEATIAEMQQAMEEGQATSADLTQAYIDRIEEIDHNGIRLNSVMEVNPEALAIAQQLDDERAGTGPRSPLHGIPILVKDNIDSADEMETTAGSLALVGVPVERDAFLIERLREAGRRGFAGQDQSQRVGQLSLDPFLQRLERPRRSMPQPLRPGPQPLWLEQRIGGRGRGEPHGSRAWNRDRRFDRVSLFHLRHRGDKADSRADQQIRRHPHRPQPGRRRAHGANGGRCRDRAGGADGC